MHPQHFHEGLPFLQESSQAVLSGLQGLQVIQILIHLGEKALRLLRPILLNEAYDPALLPSGDNRLLESPPEHLYGTENTIEFVEVDGAHQFILPAQPRVVLVNNLYVCLRLAEGHLLREEESLALLTLLPRAIGFKDSLIQGLLHSLPKGMGYI